MSAQTEEYKLLKQDIVDVEKKLLDELTKVRFHLDTVRNKQTDVESSNIGLNLKVDKILNALTDNDFNGQEGYITRLVKMEMLVKMHELYWKILFSILLGGGGLAVLLKLIVFK